MELSLKISDTVGVYILTEIYTPGFLKTSQKYSTDIATLGRVVLKKLLSCSEYKFPLYMFLLSSWGDNVNFKRWWPYYLRENCYIHCRNCFHLSEKTTI